VVYRYKKNYRIKKKKSILRNRFFWIVILFLFGIGSVAYIFFFSWVFQIKDVAIFGANGTYQKQIRSLFLDQNIFLADTAKIKKDILRSFPEIAEIIINRKLPSVLEIEIKEKLAVAVWCDQEEECFLTDKKGALFREDSFEETDLLRLFGEKDLLTEEIISQILEIDTKLTKDLAVEIKEMALVSPQEINVKTVEGWEIYFNPAGDLSWQLTQLRLVLERQISAEERAVLQYINLRFRKVYYK